MYMHIKCSNGIKLKPRDASLMFRNNIMNNYRTFTLKITETCDMLCNYRYNNPC